MKRIISLGNKVQVEKMNFAGLQKRAKNTEKNDKGKFKKKKRFGKSLANKAPSMLFFNGIRIQRDLYSAFLIMNISDDLKNFNMDKCNERFENFYRLHNIEVDRLTGKKNLSSIAI